MKLRRWLILGATILFVLTGLNPPWRVTQKTPTGHTLETRITVQWLFNDPARPRSYQSSQIASDVLCIEWLILSAAALAVHFCLPRKPEP